MLNRKPQAGSLNEGTSLLTGLDTNDFILLGTLKWIETSLRHRGLEIVVCNSISVNYGDEPKFGTQPPMVYALKVALMFVIVREVAKRTYNKCNDIFPDRYVSQSLSMTIVVAWFREMASERTFQRLTREASQGTEVIASGPLMHDCYIRRSEAVVFGALEERFLTPHVFMGLKRTFKLKRFKWTTISPFQLVFV
nr:hypothetical protein [Tanacetum cinerariifolium]